jgi:hypothetical protein
MKQRSIKAPNVRMAGWNEQDAKPSSIAIFAFLFFTLLAPLSGAHAQLNAGDVLIADQNGGTNTNGALVSVNPSTGVRTLVSDFGSDAQGALGNSPIGVAIETSGSVLVAGGISMGMSLSGALFRIDPSTGARTLLSDFANEAQGPVGRQLLGVAIESSGSVLVVGSVPRQEGKAVNFVGALFRVDRSTGVRTLLSDFANDAQGPLGFLPTGVAIDTSGSVLVVDQRVLMGTSFTSVLFRVNPSTGERTVLSDFGNEAQGPRGVSPFGVAIENSGSILVVDGNAGTSSAGGLFRINASTGGRTLLSDFGNQAQGPLGVFPLGAAIDASGTILVTDDEAGAGGAGVLFTVDPADGTRTFISGFGNAAQGPVGNDPAGLAVVRDLEVCNGQAPTSGCTVNGVPSETCLGTTGEDTIIGTEGNDVIVGLAGNDTITGGAGNDLICGGAGNDTLMGGKKPDQLFGQDGDDTLRGGRGTDALDGGNGNDTCVGGLGSDGAANCETVSNVP